MLTSESRGGVEGGAVGILNQSVVSWFFLSFFIINEGLEAYHIPELFTYSAAITLSALHIYNLKYCTCKDDECCVHKV